jgi:tetratricopeptide (TPR) repeat protein
LKPFNGYKYSIILLIIISIIFTISCSSTVSPTTVAIATAKYPETTSIPTNESYDEDSENKDTWYNKAFDFDNLGEYEEAIECYDAAIELDPEDSIAWYNKGVALVKISRYGGALKLGNFDGTIESYDEAIWLGKYYGAIECLDEAIGIDPESADAWNNKGVALDNLGRLEKHEEAINYYEEAIECYDEAIKLDPEDSIAWYNKGNTLNILGK